MHCPPAEAFFSFSHTTTFSHTIIFSHQYLPFTSTPHQHYHTEGAVVFKNTVHLTIEFNRNTEQEGNYHCVCGHENVNKRSFQNHVRLATIKDKNACTLLRSSLELCRANALLAPFPSDVININYEPQKPVYVSSASPSPHPEPPSPPDTGGMSASQEVQAVQLARLLEVSRNLASAMNSQKRMSRDLRILKDKLSNLETMLRIKFMNVDNRLTRIERAQSSRAQSSRAQSSEAKRKR